MLFYISQHPLQFDYGHVTSFGRAEMMHVIFRLKQLRTELPLTALEAVCSIEAIWCGYKMEELLNIHQCHKSEK